VGKNLVVAKEQTKTAKVMLKEWEQGVSPQMIVHHASVVAVAKANLILSVARSTGSLAQARSETSQ
jgi:hypothetical protein